jgi:hypothetical protein
MIWYTDGEKRLPTSWAAVVVPIIFRQKPFSNAGQVEDMTAE